MINIQDIIPFMKDGWVAMDENGYYRYFLRKPFIDKERKVWRADISCDTCSLKCFDIAPADDWTKSLIKVGGK